MRSNSSKKRFTEIVSLFLRGDKKSLRMNRPTPSKGASGGGGGDGGVGSRPGGRGQGQGQSQGRGFNPASPSSSNRTPTEQELFNDAKVYPAIGVLGKGAYGTVYKAKDPDNVNQYVALKNISVSLSDDGVPPSTIREIAVLRQLERLNHPNIVKLRDICYGRRLERKQQLSLILVFEHIDQDLHQYLERCPPEGLSHRQIKHLLFQIVCGVDFLHSNRVVHRDLKPQNILVTSNGEVKLADFGLARLYCFQTALTSVVVTLWYRAPEILLNSSYATPIDIWSVGCVFAELFMRRALFPGQSELDTLSKIFDLIGTPKPEQWPADAMHLRHPYLGKMQVPLERIMPELALDPLAKDLMEKMLTFDPENRISACNALEHPYLNDLVPPQVSPTPPPVSAASSMIGFSPPTVPLQWMMTHPAQCPSSPGSSLSNVNRTSSSGLMASTPSSARRLPPRPPHHLHHSFDSHDAATSSISTSGVDSSRDAETAAALLADIMETSPPLPPNATIQVLDEVHAHEGTPPRPRGARHSAGTPSNSPESSGGNSGPFSSSGTSDVSYNTSDESGQSME